MLALSKDPTDLALMQAIPFLPAPLSGESPAIDELTKRPTGQGYIAGADGVFLHLARPWLLARIPLSGPLPIQTLYGLAGPARLDLICGLIPGALIDIAADFFRQSLPNEAACFIIWNSASNAFRISPAEIIKATPSRLSYRPPNLASGDHIVADIHSHGAGHAFWSMTDDIDDACHTRLSIVVGLLQHDNNSLGEFIARFSASGVFAPLPKQPTTDVTTLSYRITTAAAAANV